MTTDTAVAVVGGGYAGLFAARRAARALPAAAGRVVLIDPDEHWEERTRWHQLAAGEDIQQLSRKDLFRGTRVDVVAACVASIDLDARRLKFTDGAPELSFERLVHTPGSRSDPRTVEGAAEHALTLDSPAASRDVAAAVCARPGGRVVVVGGGLTGIQTAAQIADDHRPTTVTLVSSGPVGQEFPESARGHVAAALDRLGVARRENLRVTAVEPGRILWAGGHLDADTVVWTAGFAPSPLAAQAGLAVSDAGQVVVDEALRSVSHPFVFAAGDAACVPRAASPYGAYAATGTGATAGRNAALDLAGSAPEPLDLGYAFLSASLGRRNAVIHFLRSDGSPRNQVLAGRVAHHVKEGIERYVAGALRAERHIPGVYHWSPGPRSRDRG